MPHDGSLPSETGRLLEPYFQPRTFKPGAVKSRIVTHARLHEAIRSDPDLALLLLKQLSRRLRVNSFQILLPDELRGRARPLGAWFTQGLGRDVHFEAHIETRGDSLTRTGPLAKEIERPLRERYAIHHITLQFENGHCLTGTDDHLRTLRRITEP